MRSSFRGGALWSALSALVWFALARRGLARELGTMRFAVDAVLLGEVAVAVAGASGSPAGA